MAKQTVVALQKALAKKGWTQNELARQLGTNSAVVSRWMTGQRRPGLEMALKMESLLGVPAKLWIETAA